MTARKTTTVVKKKAAKSPSRQRTVTKVIPEDRVGKVGNTTLLTKVNADKLIEAVTTGVPLDLAADYCGIHRDTIRKWRRRGEKAIEMNARMRSPTERRYADFATRLGKAMSETSVLAQATMKRLIIGPRVRSPETGEIVAGEMSDTQLRIQADLIKFYLGRRERKHYGQNVQAEISGPGGGPVLTADLTGEEAWEAFVAMFGDPSDDE